MDTEKYDNNYFKKDQLMGLFAVSSPDKFGEYIFRGGVRPYDYALQSDIANEFCLEFHFLLDVVPKFISLYIEGVLGILKVCVNGIPLRKILESDHIYDCDLSVNPGRNILKIYVENCDDSIVFNQPAFLLLYKK